MYYTDKERAALSGFLAFEPGIIKDYTPAEIKKILPKEKWPLFDVQKMDADVQDRYSTVYVELAKQYGKKKKIKGGEEYVVPESMKMNLHLQAGIRAGVTGWKNVRNRDGKLIDMKKDERGIMTAESYHSINWKMRDALHVVIMTGDDKA